MVAQKCQTVREVPRAISIKPSEKCKSIKQTEKMSDRLVKRKADCASEEEVYGAEEETPPKNVAKHREQLQQFRVGFLL
ncbi:hypothetical protein GPALN_010108 [Globodera pallida]|nr:hypothetical protein GPALN_010108 [Globodera pallida]